MVGGNLLLVEGSEDKRVLPQLLERAGVPWGARGAEVVRVHGLGGYTNLTADELALQLKTAGLQRLGLLVDADADPPARWASVRAVVSPRFALPGNPPAGGAVLAATSTAPRFGVWMMPDNAGHGMLETFLLALRPDEPGLLAHAKQSTDAATQHGAPFVAAHRDKALIHTWLAWRDPPGRQLHQAVQEKMLDPTGPYAATFVTWFKSLFELP